MPIKRHYLFYIKAHGELTYIYNMKRAIILALVFLITLLAGNTQTGGSDSLFLIQMNQRIDDHVLQQKVPALDSLYADDFVFSHGTGTIEGKQGWLKTVGSTKYLLRRHDSVSVELHPALAIVRGNLHVRRMNNDAIIVYRLKYIRVYSMRNGSWQMISHITTQEHHEP